MPSIATIVADLQAGTVVGVGQSPPSHITTMDKTISDTCRVKYNFVHMNASISGANRLSCAGAADSLNFNGSYLFFEDDWTTVANMDINRRLVVSGKFSGCMWKVFRESAGNYKCAHIARPGGGGANALVSLVTQGTAVQKGWVEVQSIPTAGMVGGAAGVVEVFVVSQYFPANNRIDSIAIGVNNQGLVVNSVFQSDGG